MPTKDPAFVFVIFPAGVAQDSNGDHSQRAKHKINYNYKVTRVENLVGWWKFDETSGTVAEDSSGGDANASVFGNASWAGAEAKFGAGALFLDGNDSFAVAPAFMTPDKITRAEDLNGHWPFDATSGTPAANLGTTGATHNASLINGASFSTTEKRFGNASLH